MRWLLNLETGLDCVCIAPAWVIVLQGASAKAASELDTALQCFLNGMPSFLAAQPIFILHAGWIARKIMFTNTLYWFCTFPNCLPVQLHLCVCSLVCSPNSNTKSHVSCYHSGWALMEYLFHFSDYPIVFWGIFTLFVLVIIVSAD